MIEDFFDYQHQEKNGGQCTDGEKVTAAVGMGGGVAAPGAAFGLEDRNGVDFDVEEGAVVVERGVE